MEHGWGVHGVGSAAAVPGPDFVIVGTPRSGTTLVQRLVSELPGIGIPPETHLLSRFALPILERRSFPLAGRELEEELRVVAEAPTSQGLALEPAAVVDALGGRCPSLLDLFGGVVRVLAGEARLHGEKTPEHLRWVGPLAAADPDLKVVGVVRDPRAVAASHAAVPWGVSPPRLLGVQWCIDEDLLRVAQSALGERFLLVRYEDAVADPHATQCRLAAFLGAGAAESPPPPRTGSRPQVVLDWEWWKHRARGPVTTERVDAWREALEPDDARDVAALCRDRMERLGYDDLPDASQAARWQARWDDAVRAEHAAFVAGKAASQSRIDAVRLDAGRQPGVPAGPLGPR